MFSLSHSFRCQALDLARYGLVLHRRGPATLSASAPIRTIFRSPIEQGRGLRTSSRSSSRTIFPPI